jgi:hypothetical protein
VGGQANWHVKLKLPNSYVILPWVMKFLGL